MTDRKEIIFDIFRKNSVDYPGNYEVTPGQAIKIVNEILKLAGNKEMMLALLELAQIDSANNSVNNIKKIANKGIDACELSPF